MRLTRLVGLCMLVSLTAVPSAAAFRFTDGTRLMPTGLVGQPYVQKIEFAGGCKGVYVLIDSGGMPPGLRLVGTVQEDTESSNWRIEGVPTAPGNFSFWLRGKNLCPADSTEEPFTISVGRGITIETRSIPNATAGTPYRVRLSASGGGSMRWSVASGRLPTGLRLDADGTLVGTPVTRAPSAHAFTVRAGDGARVAVRELALTVHKPIAVVAPSAPQFAEVGRPIALTLRSSGGAGGHRWSLSGLPGGLSFEPATSALSGTPLAAGTFVVKAAVTDYDGRVARFDLPLTVSARLRLPTFRLPAARVDVPYRIRLRTKGGAGPLTWKLLRVRPSSAVRFDRRTGTVTLTPQVARRVSITVRVRDALSAVATRTYVLDVRPREVD